MCFKMGFSESSNAACMFWPPETPPFPRLYVHKALPLLPAPSYSPSSPPAFRAAPMSLVCIIQAFSADVKNKDQYIY